MLGYQDRLFVVYGGVFDKGTVAELDAANKECSFKTQVSSPYRVKGSVNGPGGQCVSLPALKTLVWLDNDSNRVVAYNYETKKFKRNAAVSIPASFYKLQRYTPKSVVVVGAVGGSWDEYAYVAKGFGGGEDITVTKLPTKLPYFVNRGLFSALPSESFQKVDSTSVDGFVPVYMR